jgi:hypothetical protein
MTFSEGDRISTNHWEEEDHAYVQWGTVTTENFAESVWGNLVIEEVREETDDVIWVIWDEEDNDNPRYTHPIYIVDHIIFEIPYDPTQQGDQEDDI